MDKTIRIGTRESQLAVWQATQVQELLTSYGYTSELVFIKSEGDIDLKTPLYEMGVQGIFTRSLDIALLNNRIDIAVHSMKDVPTQLPDGIIQSAALKRGSYKDLLVMNHQSSPDSYRDVSRESPTFDNPFTIHNSQLTTHNLPLTIATSSIRRKAQWLNRYPDHLMVNLRGNVNTRLKKLEGSNWHGAIFAAAGLERIGLRPENSIELDWMLPAPAQGAIMTACRENDLYSLDACRHFNDEETALCTKIERDFLRTLLGGCSTPISALAVINENKEIFFRGNILSLDGKEKIEIEKRIAVGKAGGSGRTVAEELLQKGGQKIAEEIRHAAK